jgi:3D (Asp-Asp-Asp) domain-containing protein
MQVKQEYREVYAETTGYTLGDGNTPSTIMANGEKPHSGAVAYNRVPLGTRLEIQGKIYVVSDRAMNDDIVDIYMDSIEECMMYGRRIQKIKILED